MDRRSRHAWGCGRKPHAAFASSGTASVGSPFAIHQSLLPSPSWTLVGAVCGKRRPSPFPSPSPFLVEATDSERERERSSNERETDRPVINRLFFHPLFRPAQSRAAYLHAKLLYRPRALRTIPPPLRSSIAAGIPNEIFIEKSREYEREFASLFHRGGFTSTLLKFSESKSIRPFVKCDRIFFFFFSFSTRKNSNFSAYRIPSSIFPFLLLPFFLFSFPFRGWLDGFLFFFFLRRLSRTISIPKRPPRDPSTLL